MPEIVYGVSLGFSPHVLLFSILFYVNAFEAPYLTSMEDLRRLFVEDGQQEMPLPLKRDMDNYYVFPKVDLVCGQARILWETPMDGHTLDAQLRTFNEYTASLIICSPTSSDMGEVTCSIKVVGEILLIA